MTIVRYNTFEQIRCNFNQAYDKLSNAIFSGNAKDVIGIITTGKKVISFCKIPLVDYARFHSHLIPICTLICAFINVIKGIDVSGPIDENGQNILHLASYAGLLDLIVYFMNELSPDKRPQVNTKDFHGWTRNQISFSFLTFYKHFLLQQATVTFQFVISF